jgi:hypothetical protein
MTLTVWGPTWGRDLKLTPWEWQQLRAILKLSEAEIDAGGIHVSLDPAGLLSR